MGSNPTPSAFDLGIRLTTAAALRGVGIPAHRSLGCLRPTRLSSRAVGEVGRYAAAARLCHHTVAETCEHIWTGHSLRAGCAPQLDRDGVDLQTIERYLWQLTLGWVSGMRAASVSLGEPHAAVPGADDMPELLAALDLAYAAAVCDVAHLVVTAALADDDLDAVRTAIATALLVAPTTKRSCSTPCGSPTAKATAPQPTPTSPELSKSMTETTRWTSP